MNKYKELDELYKLLPNLHCKKLCHESCGPIGLSSLEYKRISNNKELKTTKLLICPLLTNNGECGVYKIRPMICRLWGIVKGMECPFGCVPEKFLTREQGVGYLGLAREIGGKDTYIV